MKTPKSDTPVHTHAPSKYQSAIFDYLKNGTGHLVVKAVAGGSKTTTAVESLQYIPKANRALFLAFNKSIATTLQTRVPKNVKASTIHAYGYSVIKQLYPTAQMDEYKVYQAIQYLSKDQRWTIPYGERAAFFNRIEKIVNLMRLTLNDTEEKCYDLCDHFNIDCEDNEVRYAMEVFEEVTDDIAKFDYTDMIYRPATETFKTKGFDFIYVDEFQDCSEAQYRFIRKLLAPQGRLIVIGDPCQSIYAYLGAEPKLFDEALREPNTVQLPLSISYRCSKAVVRWAKNIVPAIEARDDAPEGSVVHDGSIKNVQDGDFVLCRTNFPLVCLCMQFIKQGKKALIKGSDVGKNLVSFIKPYESQSIEDMEEGLLSKRAKLMTKLTKKFPDKQLESLPEFQSFDEKSMTIEVIKENCLTVKEIMDKIGTLFSDNQTTGVVLSTVHKAKGLEAKNVFIIEPQLIPFPYAKEEWQLEQEKNIDYVARTRAIDKLEYIRDWTSFTKSKS